MPQIIDGKIYIAPGMVLIDRETGKTLTEDEYFKRKKNEKHDTDLD